MPNEFSESDQSPWRLDTSSGERSAILEELCDKVEQEVLDKYKVGETQKGACKGRGEPLRW